MRILYGGSMARIELLMSLFGSSPSHVVQGAAEAEARLIVARKLLGSVTAVWVPLSVMIL